MIPLFPVTLAVAGLICVGGFAGAMIDFDGDNGFEVGSASALVVTVLWSLLIDIMTLP